MKVTIQITLMMPEDTLNENPQGAYEVLRKRLLEVLNNSKTFGQLVTEKQITCKAQYVQPG